MKNYCQLKHLQFSGDPSVSYEIGIAYNDDDQPCTRPLSGFSSDQISIEVSSPKSPSYTTPRTRKMPGRHNCSCCSSPVRDYYDNYYPRTPAYTSQQVQYSPKLALPFMAPNRSFKSFKIQDRKNYEFCGWGYPYVLVTPHKTVFTPRRTAIQDDADHDKEEDNDDDQEWFDNDDGLLLKRVLNVCRSLPENLEGQLKNLEGLDKLASIEDILTMSSTTSRGLGDPMEDLSLKLERFKIRTVDLDDIVIEEDQKK